MGRPLVVLAAVAAFWPLEAAARSLTRSEDHGALNQLLKLHQERQEQRRRQGKPVAQVYAGEPVEGYYKEQLLDHFDASDKRTWSQRYEVNWEFYKPGGPVILMIGGEGPVSPRDVGTAFIDYDLAKDFGGVMVAVEHRFYGTSQPFKDLATENLRYLTSRQALADLARFTDWFNTLPQLTSGATWYCLGGSYPGNLAAWYRMLYPEKVAACLASSAPVLAKEDFFEYGEMVWSAMSSNGYGDGTSFLHAGYNEVREALALATPEGRKELLEAFKACPGTVISDVDKDNLEQTVSGALSEIVQYNNSMIEGRHIEDFQAVIHDAETPVDAAMKVSKLLHVSGVPGGDNCSDYSMRAFYAQLLDVNASAETAASRSWYWQTCNEFGYFQTMRVPSMFSNRTLFTAGVSNPALWQGVCEVVFGVPKEEVASRISRSNAFYGGRMPHLSNVLFTNGQYDPWSTLSIKTVSPELAGKGVSSLVVPHGSHCAGLYGGEEKVQFVYDALVELFKKSGPSASNLLV